MTLAEGRLEGHELVASGSVSNLGPGFDALSVAVQLYLRVRIVEVRPHAPDTIETHFSDGPPGPENRIERAYRHARSRQGRQAPGVRIQVDCNIPTRAGLGSSGAATIAGLRLYELLTGPLDQRHLLALATDVEGHPDNASAALLGGLTVSCQQDDGLVRARAWRWPDDVKLVVATPEAELETAHARRVLPDTLTMGDAVFNLQRALLLVHALQSGGHDDLREALRDRWHQPTRGALVPGLVEALAIEGDGVLGACLSGAGPSIVVFSAGDTDAPSARLRGIYDRLGLGSTIRVLAAHQPAGR